MVQPSSLSLWVSSRSSVGSPATRRLPIKPSAGTSAFAGTWSTQLTGPALGSARFAARRCSGRGEPSDYDRNAATDPDGIPPSRAVGRGPAEVWPGRSPSAVPCPCPFGPPRATPGPPTMAEARPGSGRTTVIPPPPTGARPPTGADAPPAALRVRRAHDRARSRARAGPPGWPRR